MFGLLGLLSKKNRGGIEFDLNLSEIESMTKTSFGLNKNIIVLKLKDGKEQSFSLNSDYEIWENAINSAK